MAPGDNEIDTPVPNISKHKQFFKKVLFTYFQREGHKEKLFSRKELEICGK